MKEDNEHKTENRVLFAVAALAGTYVALSVASVAINLFRVCT